MSGIMTEKLAPRWLVFEDFEFTKNDVKRLEGAAEMLLSESQIFSLSNAFGNYLSQTVIFSYSSSPKMVKKVLGDIKKPLNELISIFDQFWGTDGLNAFVMESINIAISASEDNEEKTDKNDDIKSTPLGREKRNKNPLYLVTGHLIDQQLKTSPETSDPFDIAYLHAVFRIALLSIEAALQKITSPGGPLRAPHVTEFLIDLINIICPASGRGPYHSSTVNFIEEARTIIGERLEVMGEEAAKKDVMKLAKSNLVGRIRDALNEDAKTDGRARIREASE